MVVTILLNAQMYPCPRCQDELCYYHQKMKDGLLTPAPPNKDTGPDSKVRLVRNGEEVLYRL